MRPSAILLLAAAWTGLAMAQTPPDDRAPGTQPDVKEPIVGGKPGLDPILGPIKGSPGQDPGGEDDGEDGGMMGGDDSSNPGDLIMGKPGDAGASDRTRTSFGAVDADGNGSLSRAEVEADQKLRTRFATMDADHNGSVSRSEFDRASKK